MQLVAFWPVLEVGSYGPEPGMNRFIGCTVNSFQDRVQKVVLKTLNIYRWKDELKALLCSVSSLSYDCKLGLLV